MFWILIMCDFNRQVTMIYWGVKTFKFCFQEKMLLRNLLIQLILEMLTRTQRNTTLRILKRRWGVSLKEKVRNSGFWSKTKKTAKIMDIWDTINFVLRKSIQNQEKRFWENALIFYQILLTNSLRICTEISLKNLHVDIGA